MDVIKYMSPNRQSLKFVGLWPPVKTSSQFLIFETHMALSVGSLVIVETMYILLEDIKYHEILKSFSAIAFHIFAILAATQFLVKGNIITKVVNIINRESFEELITCDGPELAQKRRQTMKLASRNADWLHKFLCASAMSSILFSYTSALAVPVKTFDPNLNRTLSFREKPYTNWTPLNVDKIYNFILDTLYQCYTITYATACFACVECFFMGCMLVMSAQLQIINDVLKNIHFRRTEDCPGKRKLGKCIKEIRQLIEISNLFESIWNQLLLLHNIINTFVICNIVVILPEEIGQRVKVVGYVIVVILASTEPFIYAWCCQSLTDEYLELANAVYLSNWYKGDITTVKDITFVIARMQKPITITMGKFAPNDLQVYIGIMKISYSFYTLLLTRK